MYILESKWKMDWRQTDNLEATASPDESWLVTELRAKDLVEWTVKEEWIQKAFRRYNFLNVRDKGKGRCGIWEEEQVLRGWVWVICGTFG